jgi:hypothetical protein
MGPRIFGIGLSRTGSRSLQSALAALGLHIVHHPLDATTHRALVHWGVPLSILAHHDGVSDVGAATFLEAFDAACPGSRFVWTVRDREDWLASMTRLNECWLAEVERGVARQIWGRARFDQRAGLGWLSSIRHARSRLRTQHFLRRAAYGALAFRDPTQLLDVYDAHCRRVRDHFRDRATDLLEIDICGGDGWELLCPFVDRPIPDAPFPHAGSPTARDRRRNEPSSTHAPPASA